MKIYIVKAFGGQWEDSWEHSVIVVKSEERAKELVEQYQKVADEYHEKMVWYQDNTDKIPEHLNDMQISPEIDEETWCSEECVACHVESYFAGMDADYYSYEEVEMEG